MTRFHDTADANRAGLRSWSSLIATVVVTIAAMTPVFLTSAQAAPIESGLGLSPTAFGIGLTCFFTATALGSVVARRVVVSVPIPAVLAIISVVAAASTVGLATCHGMAQLLGFLTLAGLGNALCQPAAAKVIASDIAPGRLSLATGLVGGALGAAPTVPGLLVTLIGVSHGWRATHWVAFVLIAATLPLAWLAHRRGAAGRDVPGRDNAASTNHPQHHGIVHPPKTISRVVALWTIAAALGSVGTNVCASYFVQIGTSSGLPESTAGIMLTVAGLLAVAIRVGVGATADRQPHRNPGAVAAMMLIGAIGMAVIACATPVTFIVGALLAVPGGWGWTGLLFAATMRLLPGESARAGAAMQGGLFAGAAVGPVAFGAISTSIGIPATVGLAAFACLAAAAITATGARMVRPAPAPRGLDDRLPAKDNA